MNIRFVSKTHTYYLEDTIVPGATTIKDCIPKPWLVEWALDECGKHVEKCLLPNQPFTAEKIAEIVDQAKKAHAVKRDKAAEHGIRVHKLLADIITGQLRLFDAEPEAIKKALAKFRQWEENVRPQWLESEVIVGSKKYMFCGTFDALAIIQNKLTLIDFKTSSRVTFDFYVQLAGYQICLEEMRPGIKIEQRMIIHIPKTGAKCESHIVPTTFEEDKGVFLAALAIYRYMKRFEKK